MRALFVLGSVTQPWQEIMVAMARVGFDVVWIHGNDAAKLDGFSCDVVFTDNHAVGAFEVLSIQVRAIVFLQLDDVCYELS